LNLKFANYTTDAVCLCSQSHVCNTSEFGHPKYSLIHCRATSLVLTVPNPLEILILIALQFMHMHNYLCFRRMYSFH